MWTKSRSDKATFNKEVASRFKLPNKGILFELIRKRYDHNDIVNSSKLDAKIFLPTDLDISQFTLERSKK